MLLRWIHKNRNTKKLQIIRNQLKGFLIRTKKRLMDLAHLKDLEAKIHTCINIRLCNQLSIIIKLSNSHELAMA